MPQLLSAVIGAIMFYYGLKLARYHEIDPAPQSELVLLELDGVLDPNVATAVFAWILIAAGGALFIRCVSVLIWT